MFWVFSKLLGLKYPFFSKLIIGFCFYNINFKKSTTWELWVKFYLGQNEDCSWEDSTSGSFEGMLQRGSGGGRYYKILGKKEFNAVKHLLYKRFSASHEELMSPWRDLVFLNRKRCKYRGHEISSWKLWRPSPAVSLEHTVPHSPPWIPIRAFWKSAAAAQDSVSSEADDRCSCCHSVTGKCSLQGPICSWHKKMRSFNRYSGGKESACSARDPNSIPGSGRSPGEGNGYQPQDSCLENSMNRGAWWATV